MTDYVTRIARAMKDNLAKQWKAVPLGEPHHPADTWTAESGTIDLEELTRAALLAATEPDVSMIDAGGIIEIDNVDDLTLPAGAMAARQIFSAMIKRALEEK